jgi:hypothetical protein
MIDLMPHQKSALLQLKNGSILRGGTGSGKTITALSYYNDIETIEKLIVITTARKRETGDWEAEARYFGLYPKVDSWHNLDKYKDVEGAFFIFDEQRVVGSGTWVQAFLKITSRNQWILLSATPGDTWMDYVPVFIANGFFRNRTEFCRSHVVFSRFAKYPKVERYIGTSYLERLRQQITVEMPFERHTTRHLIDVFCEYDREAYNLAWKGRWNATENRPIRSVAELYAIMRRVTNSHPSRLQRVSDLLVGHPKLVIFYNLKEELEMLRTLDVKQAEWNGQKHEMLPDGDEWVYLVQYMAGSEAWNCVETDSMVLYSLPYSYRQFAQAQGRIDRLDTEYSDLYYYVLSSSSGIDTGIAETLSEKKNFSETSHYKKAA